MAFAGGSAFDIGGVPVAGGTAVIEAGLDFNVSRNATLDLSNSGQFECGLSLFVATSRAILRTLQCTLHEKMPKLKSELRIWNSHPFKTVIVQELRYGLR